jgi:Na+-transporting NADH:ubiquinone oxidoreductase subunit NqrE
MIIGFKKSINFLVSQFATRLTAIHDTVDFSLMKMRQNIKIIFLKGIKFLTMCNAVMDDVAIPLNRLIHRFANPSKRSNAKCEEKST